ncbi:putative WRKY transcription factor 43 [Hibiscus syriacus]|uniref:WRKY transcription factor 43 n=1 Tax=Hibiscus syriacus TaxID=106335 RepID=A0A6A3A081_HIBSY|nr:putative WRKY transcription factor 43 [Hibiscus syriacus]
MEKDQKDDDGSDDGLVRELLDNESPFFVVSQGTMPSNVYSGPRIQDIEHALSVSNWKDVPQAQEQTRIGSMVERNLSRMEYKYTLKIKSCGNGMADDGYKWRKYGQKSIKNSPYPRVKWAPIVLAELLQVHQSKMQCQKTSGEVQRRPRYTHHHLRRPSPTLRPPIFPFHDDNAAIKKQKKAVSESKSPAHEASQTATNDINNSEPLQPSPCPQEIALEGGFGQQGLLEDVVPWMIRNPSHNNGASSNSSSCSTSSRSRSAPASPSSLSWSPGFDPWPVFI